MVAASVAVLQLIGVCTGGQSHELMSETDGENRNIALVKLSYLVNDGSAVLGVAGAVGKHDAVRIRCEDLLCTGSGRIDRNLAASLMQGTGDIALGAQIQKCHPVAVIFQDRLFSAGNLLDHLTGTVCL